MKKKSSTAQKGPQMVPYVDKTSPPVPTIFIPTRNSPTRMPVVRYDQLFPYSPQKQNRVVDRSIWDVILRKVPVGYTIPDRDVIRELSKWSKSKG